MSFLDPQLSSHKGKEVVSQSTRPRKARAVFACLQAILEEMIAKGSSVHIAGHSACALTLSVLLTRAKIVFDLYHNDAKILELCRIMDSLNCGALAHSRTELT